MLPERIAGTAPLYEKSPKSNSCTWLGIHHAHAGRTAPRRLAALGVPRFLAAPRRRTASPRRPECSAPLSCSRRASPWPRHDSLAAPSEPQRCLLAAHHLSPRVASRDERRTLPLPVALPPGCVLLIERSTAREKRKTYRTAARHACRWESIAN